MRCWNCDSTDFTLAGDDGYVCAECAEAYLTPEEVEEARNADGYDDPDLLNDLRADR